MTVVYVIVAAIVGGAAIYLWSRIRAKSLLNEAREKSSRVDEEIRGKIREADGEISHKRREFELEKKEKLHKLNEDFEEGTREKRKELHELSERLIVREESMDSRLQEIEKKKERIQKTEQEFMKKREKIAALKGECRKELERIAELSTDQAKRDLLENVKKEAQKDAAQIVRKAEQEAKEEAGKKARKIIAIAIQRCAVSEATENSSVTLTLPNDEMKGRIIGREGRNIRTFEALTGVDLVVDDTQGSVVISCFHPLRRKIAEISLERLIKDTRIHPARIEEVVEKVKGEMEEKIQEEGEGAAFDLGISDLPSKLNDLLGRLKYRTSYGQNVLEHSKEVARIASMFAAELGADYNLAKRAGLLHDIGKAVDHEIEGSHALIGADLAEKYGESPEIVHAIAAHHEDEGKEINTVLAILTQVADAVSAARPGARKEAFEAYLKRIEELEKIACSFAGVNNAFAVHAGREIRIMVEPDDISDDEARELSRDIAAEIEKELKYPGQIKVTVIRELRSTDFAK